MINIYNAKGNYCVHEDTETGKVELVYNNSVVKSALPKREANYADILSYKRELLTVIKVGEL